MLSPSPTLTGKELRVHDQRFLQHSPVFGFLLPTAAEPTQRPSTGCSVSKGLAPSGACTLGLPTLGCPHPRSDVQAPEPKSEPRPCSFASAAQWDQSPPACSSLWGSTRQPGGAGQCVRPGPPWRSSRAVLRRKCKAGVSRRSPPLFH